MKLVYTCNSCLPKLAWWAKVDCLKKTVVVEHGNSVECREKFFIEGAWNGPFKNGDFATSDCVFGTGAVICGESPVFVSSSCTTDYLYYHQKTDEHVTVSNSLPLLLASIKHSLNPSFPGYNGINDSIIHGIDRYIREVPTLQGSVRRLMYRNLLVDAGGISEVEKDMPPFFSCYEEYYSYISDNYKLFVKNVREATRKTKIEICSTQSKGYDSTAVNAIAAKYGLDKVFTILKGKNPNYFATQDAQVQVDDDGRKICSALGLTAIPIDRRAFEGEFKKEYLYHAALHRNQDFNLKDIEKYLSDVSILLTGNLGEIWATSKYYACRPGNINSELKRGDLAGHGLSEVRLVVGFIQVPLIYLGARRREDIFRITESVEMDRWRLGTAYDRPIARRIGEEAGIQREAFGQVKAASVVLFPMPVLPYGEELRNEFLEFVVREKLLPRWKIKLWPLVHFANTAIAFRSTRYKLLYYFERVVSMMIGRKFEFKPLWSRLKGSVFCFCVNKCAREYEGYLRNRKPGDSEEMKSRQ